MKKILLLSVWVLLISVTKAQLISFTPDFPLDNSTLVITLDATKGNQALQNNAGPVYVHTGVITSLSTGPSDWKYVPTVWASSNALHQMQSAGTNKWTYTITNIRSFFNVPPGEQILRVNFVFRNQAGSIVQRNADGSDMYIPIYQAGEFAIRFTAPPLQPTYNMTPEPISQSATSLPVTVVSSQNANITIRFNGNQIGTASNATTASGTANITTTCEQSITVEAVNGPTTRRDTIRFFRNPTNYPTGIRPAGRKDGITFENNNTEAVFILYAPGKNSVSIVGDFNNWTQTCAGLMTRETDINGNNYYWTRVTGLTPGTPYRFQYIIDNQLRVTDPYSELILDPNNDRFISSATYPNIPAYPTGKASGLVSVITPGEAPFVWTDGSYVRPDKKDLMIYELLVRDFTAAQNWQTLRDTLSYLVRTGFNAIKIMPFNEFDGNNSWGYNPNHYFAPDKAYGTKNALKAFINECHLNGVAVIMDIALNHATGQSPLAAMWWNSALNQPAADNPYFYQTAQHPFNVYNDFNHNVAPTRFHTERFIEHWLTEYKMDGFRWDLSKGFTTNNCGSDIGCWNSFNQGRIDIWQNYYNKMQAASAGSYCILEHLGNDDEEYELAARGMLLWGKMTDQFNENTMGTSGNKDVSRAYWKNRPFWNNAFLDDKPRLIAYAESHDEERIMYKNLNFGNNTNGSHNVRTLSVALARTEAMAAVLMAIPGPKMIWQFGEVGYDFSINRCENGTIDANCRTSPKPVRWDYWTVPVPNGRRRLYETFSAMARLRRQRLDAFNRTTVSTGTDFGNNFWKSVVIDHSTLKMVVVANFNINQATQSVTFPQTGTWFDYTNGGSINVAGSAQNVTLPAGGYRVYINQNIAGGLVTDTRDVIASNNEFKLSVYPNPVSRSATVRYELPNSGQVNIQLINLQGQVVASKNMGFQLKGIQLFELNRTNFAATPLLAGQYILQVRVGNVVRNEKIMVQQ
jgi:1,4-alpha-glucan branching enzyme